MTTPTRTSTARSTAAPRLLSGAAETVTSLWVKGMATRMGIALAVMVLVAAVVLGVQALV